MNTPVNLKHLNAGLLDSGFEDAREDMSLEDVKSILLKRFDRHLWISGVMNSSEL